MGTKPPGGFPSSLSVLEKPLVAAFPGAFPLPFSGRRFCLTASLVCASASPFITQRASFQGSYQLSQCEISLSPTPQERELRHQATHRGSDVHASHVLCLCAVIFEFGDDISSTQSCSRLRADAAGDVSRPLPAHSLPTLVSHVFDTAEFPELSLRLGMTREHESEKDFQNRTSKQNRALQSLVFPSCTTAGAIRLFIHLSNIAREGHTRDHTRSRMSVPWALGSVSHMMSSQQTNSRDSPPPSQVTGQGQPVQLDLASDAFDDQYEGCVEQMEKMAPQLLEEELRVHRDFGVQWAKAETEWNQIKNKISHSSQLSDFQGTALVAYTGVVAKDFNRAVREFFPNQWNFQFQAFPYYLTRALQRLATGECQGV
uniref:NAD(P)(+)--arginine ADP-ribosyltransferase n=1 Tax=Oryctolagus cuniculus TaxID=9986 RepID=G1TKP7_RABIT